MSWTLLTSQALIFKAGFNANVSAVTSGAFMQRVADWCESAFCRDTEYDWVTNYANVNTVFRPAIEEVCADYGAKFLIQTDMSGYTNNGEAVTMVNILIDNYGKGVNKFKDTNIQTLAGVS